MADAGGTRRPSAGAAKEQLVSIGGRRLRITNLDKVLYPETGHDQGRGDRLLHAHRSDDDPARHRAAGDPQALARRRRHRGAPRAVVLREGPRARRARLGAAAADPALGRPEGLPAHRRRADARLPRAGREPRAARAAVALHARRRARGCRPPRARPRSGSGGRARRVRRGRALGARDPRPHGPGAVPGDERQQGHPALLGAAARPEQRVRVGDRPRAGRAPSRRITPTSSSAA